jgi:hypothetical protein
MTDHVVVGKRSGYASAEVVARTPHQRRDLVDMLVLPDQEQTEAWFGIQGQPKRWMRAGYAGTFGAALFVDETTPHGADWAWAALAPEPLATPPTIYYDPDGVTIFPLATVMPLERVHDVILEWVHTAQRPTSVDWMPINALVWELTDDGRVHVPDPAH